MINKDSAGVVKASVDSLLKWWSRQNLKSVGLTHLEGPIALVLSIICNYFSFLKYHLISYIKINYALY